MAKWFERRRDRLNKEIEVVKRNYPNAKIIMERGYLVIFCKIHERKIAYLVRVVYPKHFPFEEPKAWIVKPLMKNAQHQWKDGSLCIHGIEEVPRVSGKTVLDLARQWIIKYGN